MTTELPNRDLRQRQIIPPECLARCHGLVVGVGAIGRQVVLQLAAVGIPALDHIDFDRVGEENLASQAYWPEDLGQLKVEATARLCRALNPQVRISIYSERFRRSFARSLPSLSDPASQSIVLRPRALRYCARPLAVVAPLSASPESKFMSPQPPTLLSVLWD
jgi:hypothetical protein